MSDVVVIIGSGQIGQAIGRRVAAGKHVVLADLRRENAEVAVQTFLDAGFEAEPAVVDIASRESVRALVATATARGQVTTLIHAAGVSPSQAPVEAVLRVDLYGTAVLLEEFGRVIAPRGAGVVISSQSGYRMPALTPEEDRLLATTPTEELLGLPIVQAVDDTLHAYQLAKRGNGLRVQHEAVRWAERGARVNAISPGIVITPLARDELTGPRGAGYRRMLEKSPAGRAGTPDEIGHLGAYLLGPDAGYVSGSDFLIDGGVTASYKYGPLQPQSTTDN
ncbi:SDR family oxidoreductase [Georgenia sp. SUBG003]|uniref:SDR family oxidoreductase n=1 Tax=Georgenia sp. SUBG003 TaxID=1497974 RepID=UPI0004D37894|nr:short-chain dehydrogenase [Georgenia sp. SUBG003]